MPDTQQFDHAKAAPELVDAVVVGAGFAGLYMLHRLRKLGLSAVVFEAGGGVGGTWYWNRYPGARCDVQSLDYSYSFSEELQQEWVWSERYSPQAEILSYLEHVAERFDLKRDIRFSTRVTGAVYNEAERRWLVTTDTGAQVSAQYCIMATGCLSMPKVPEIAGMDRFAGGQYYTNAWPHEGVDFTGQRVAVIGTGSSGVQSIPVIADQASQLYVFQRTATFSIPAYNSKLDPEVLNAEKARYPERRQQNRMSRGGFTADVGELSALEVSPEERQRRYEAQWAKGGVGFGFVFTDIGSDAKANETAGDFVRDKIGKVVKDPRVAELLKPYDYPITTKRICVDSHYYETFNREHVKLVNLRETPIETLIETGIRTSGGDYEVDSIVFATGFDAMTGALAKIDIRGEGGEALAEKWAAGPRTYLGLMTAGFPNMFMITAPGSPSVLSNMVVSIEHDVEWIADCIAHLRANERHVIAADPAAENAWVDHVNELAATTLFLNANSWYLGANVPGKPRVFMPYVGGVDVYREKCTDVAAKGYEGFLLSA